SGATMTLKALQRAEVRRATAEQDRAAWRAVLDAALRTLAAAALSAALSLGAWQAWRWAAASDMFAVREIRFTGLVRAREAELLRRSGLKPGENLFRADLARAARAIKADPWVSSARLERRLPGEVLVRSAECSPAAASARRGSISTTRRAPIRPPPPWPTRGSRPWRRRKAKSSSGWTSGPRRSAASSARSPLTAST